MMLQMSSMMGGGPGGGIGAGGFPMPGAPGSGGTNTTDAQGSTGSPTGGSPIPPPLFNPLFFPPPPAGANAQGADGATGTGAGAGAGAATGAPSSPFANMLDPAAMQQMLGMLGGGAGGLPGMGAFGVPPATPTDTRPPEERFQVQLQVHLTSDMSAGALLNIYSQQLQDMGFTNAQQNIRALLATGGNVHSAIEYILGGGGL